MRDDSFLVRQDRHLNFVARLLFVGAATARPAVRAVSNTVTKCMMSYREYGEYN
jgi:hypothetical protein